MSTYIHTHNHSHSHTHTDTHSHAYLLLSNIWKQGAAQEAQVEEEGISARPVEWAVGRETTGLSYISNLRTNQSRKQRRRCGLYSRGEANKIFGE